MDTFMDDDSVKMKEKLYFLNNISQCKRFAVEQKRFTSEEIENHALWLKKDGLEIPFVEYAVTTRCSLHCRKCSNLIPYFNNPFDIELPEAKNEIRELLDCVDYIYRFKIHGGEPFLYSDITELLNWICGIDNIGEIRISTNGTIIPHQNVIYALKNPKVIVFISGYSSKIAPRRDELIRLLNQNGVRIRDLHDQVWNDTGEVIYRNYSKQKLKEIIRNCSMANCKTLRDHRLYLCSRCSNGDQLGFFHEKRTADLSKGSIEEKKREIKNLYTLDDCTGCGYCSGVIAGINEIPPAEQLKENQ